MVVHEVDTVVVGDVKGLLEVVQRRRPAVIAPGLIQLLPIQER